MGNTIYCTSCGAENSAGAKFCQNCGKPLGEKSKPIFTFANFVKKERTADHCRINLPSVLQIARSSLLILVALLLVVFSIGTIANFDYHTQEKNDQNYNYWGKYYRNERYTSRSYYDSYYYYHYDYDYQNVDVSVEISFVDNIRIFFNSLLSQDSGDIQNSDLFDRTYTQYKELMELLSQKEENEELTTEEIHLIETIEKNTFLLKLRERNVKPQYAALFAFLFGVAALMVCVLLLIFSIKNLLDLIFKKTIGKLTPALLCFVIPLYIFSGFFAKLNLQFIYENYYLSTQISPKITPVYTWGAVLASLALLTYVIPNFIKTRKSVKLWVSRGIVFALSILMICAVFSPIFTAKLTEKFSGEASIKTVKIPIYEDYYAHFDLEEVGSKKYSRYEFYTRRELTKEGEGEKVATMIALDSLVQTNTVLLNLKYAFFIVFAVAIFLVLLVQRALLDLVSLESKSTLVFNSLVLLLSGILVATASVTVFFVNLKAQNGYLLQLGSSYVMITAFAIFNYIAYAVRKFGKKKKDLPLEKQEVPEVPQEMS